MDDQTPIRWQFSLRALLVLMSACAVLFAAWRVFGANWFVQAVVFVVGSVAPAVLLRGRWRTAYLLAWGTVYGPFVVMATYMLLYVECSHCKAAAWQMLPYGPGIVLAEIVRRLVGLSRLDGVVEFGVALVLSVAFVAALTWYLKSVGRILRALGVMLVGGFCSFCAFGLMALIRA